MGNAPILKKNLPEIGSLQDTAVDTLSGLSFSRPAERMAFAQVADAAGKVVNKLTPMEMVLGVLAGANGVVEASRNALLKACDAAKKIDGE
ncbi:MAG: hypothetical protein GYA55_11430 [SAR324 cluster bacterium]|uniref:Uncharacterized protein n=1 Tax=SAR324 cluster bacterium TaxID=2024889 RepID=A0A7X9IL41_9DELT|nr:hypothetical protein [SAR324 cluster bacterium]